MHANFTCVTTVKPVSSITFGITYVARDLGTFFGFVCLGELGFEERRSKQGGDRNHSVRIRS